MSAIPAPPEFSVCYISGPITGVPDFREHFAAARTVLRADGWIVIDPTHKSPSREALAAMEAQSNPRRSPHYAQMMRMCFHEVLMSHVLFVLPGWKTSSGACDEIHLADRVQMPVRLYDEEPTRRHRLDLYSVATVQARMPDGAFVV